MTIEYLADRREFIPSVARWHHMEWGHLRPGETVEDRSKRVERTCGHREVPTTFIALAGDQLLGSASLVEHDLDIRPKLSPWLSGVFVAPEHRRRGIGAALVERVVQEAGALGATRLYLYTPGSGALYLRLGWSVVEQTFYRALWGDQQITIMESISDSPVHMNGHFRIEPCRTCFVPGYLIVTPRDPAGSLSKLKVDALASLGPTLAAATRAIEVIIRPERVYCTLFGEETRSVHFHLFPRSAWLLSQYAAAHPEDHEISGPRLLDWARRTFHDPVSDDYSEIVKAIFRALDGND